VEPGNPIGLLQQALELSVRAAPVEKRLRVDGVKTGRITALDLPGQIEQGVELGLLDQAEAEILRDYDRKVMNLINVDDFSTEELMAGVQADEGLRPLRHIA
jgi:acyl-CoA dehydrogenase